MATVACESDLARPELGPPAYPTWQAALADAVTDAAELCRLLGLPAESGDAATRAAGGLPLLVPRAFVARMRPGDPNDPLLLQVLPRLEEARSPPGFATDPLGEIGANQGPGVLWKYPGRLLIVATGSCAVHCRFCFRRNFPYQVLHQVPRRWEQLAAQVAGEPSIHEVILSGGDPLSLDDEDLEKIVGRLSAIPHLRRIRFHTRLPVVLPQRLTDALLRLLTAGPKRTIVVLHANHPNEVDGPVEAMIGRLANAGIPLFAQSVLLRGINDRADVLADLYERLIDLRVTPYYLHQLDRVAGAAHFEAPIETGLALMQELRARLPGYAVPRYVREVPGEPNKVVLE